MFVLKSDSPLIGLNLKIKLSLVNHGNIVHLIKEVKICRGILFRGMYTVCTLSLWSLSGRCDSGIPCISRSFGCDDSIFSINILPF